MADGRRREVVETLLDLHAALYDHHGMIVKERLASGQWVPPWVRYQHLARYEWAIEFCRDKRVLDAACGTGYGSEILKQVGRIVSLDIDADAVAEASHRSGQRLLFGDTVALPFANESFDVFVSFETIEHVHDDLGYTKEARRVLRSDGVFLCSTPNRAVVNPGNTITDRPFNPFHVREYTADELRAVLAQSFSEVQIFGQKSFALSYVRLLRTISQYSRMGAVRLHQLVKLALAPIDRSRHHYPAAIVAAAPEVLVAVCR